MRDMILVVNAGSSSLKFEVFQAGPSGGLARQVKARIEGIGTHPRLVASDASGRALTDDQRSVNDVGDLTAALMVARSWLERRYGDAPPLAVGHRVVHGGATFTVPVLVSNAVLKDLEKLVPLAPLHQPHNLASIRLLQQILPDVPQVACFDTAFHTSQPNLATRFAIPFKLHDEGIRRYGFHGLSYEYIAGRLPDIAPEIAKGRVIVAHLGNGASMCAMIEGKSVETTMGFTALDGLPMGTRPGQLDAGVVLHLLTEKKMTPHDLEHLLYHECGLKGVSGISADVRDLLASRIPQAELAIDLFAYRIGMLAGSLAAAMGGLDGFVFTAGIGENSPEVRERIGRRLAWLGVELDPTANKASRPCISVPSGRVRTCVVPTDEELMIGHHVLSVLGGRSAAT